MAVTDDDLSPTTRLIVQMAREIVRLREAIAWALACGRLEPLAARCLRAALQPQTPLEPSQPVSSPPDAPQHPS